MQKKRISYQTGNYPYITLILNFGNIGNEPVIVEWIRSFEKLEDI